MNKPKFDIHQRIRATVEGGAKVAGVVTARKWDDVYGWLYGVTFGSGAVEVFEHELEPQPVFRISNVINVHSVEFHRNGSAESFHMVKFNECGNNVLLLGIVFSETVAVVNPKNPSEQLRADYYERPLRQAIAEYEGGL